MKFKDIPLEFDTAPDVLTQVFPREAVKLTTSAYRAHWRYWRFVGVALEVAPTNVLVQVYGRVVSNRLHKLVWIPRHDWHETRPASRIPA